MECYHCEIYDMFIKPKSKSKHFKSNNHKNLDKHKHIKLTIDNPNIDELDKVFYAHINEYNKQHEHYLVRCEFKLVFSNMDGYPFASSNLTDNKTMVSWKIFVGKVIKNLKMKHLILVIYHK